MEKLLLSYYGDDFTGSTDVMESLALNGVPTALFLEPPDLEQVKKFRLKNQVSGEMNQLQAFGVAGISRSLTKKQMDQELPPIFRAIAQIPSRFFHYKVCSTFDSSNDIGSIGQAVELAYQYFPCRHIPLLIGAPALNRFCLFGNLFARIDGITYRLDRHPTMSKHPVTPMQESDLRLHLARQTNRKIHLLDLFSQEAGYEALLNQFHLVNDGQGSFILIDILNQQHLLQAGRLFWETSIQNRQLLAGSSGIDYAITGYLQQAKQITKPPAPASPGKAEQLLVMAGSAAPTTRKQIEWAIQKGFITLRIDSRQLVEPDKRRREFQNILDQARVALSEGKSLCLYTAFGPDDPVIKETKSIIEQLQTERNSGEIIASAQGELMREILEITRLKRVVVAGGDTSGYISRALRITALETLVPIAPGAPLCTAHSSDPRFDGLEISLKGGQNGKPDYFECVLHGKSLP